MILPSDVYVGTTREEVLGQVAEDYGPQFKLIGLRRPVPGAHISGELYLSPNTYMLTFAGHPAVPKFDYNGPRLIYKEIESL